MYVEVERDMDRVEGDDNEGDCDSDEPSGVNVGYRRHRSSPLFGDPG